MPIVTQDIMITLCAVLRPLPIGTNLALLHFMWMLVSGKLLNSRGALFPGLLNSGLSTAEIRRAWAAFGYGRWRIDELLTHWRQYVLEQGAWGAHQYESYRLKAVGLTAFWRPQLKGTPRQAHVGQKLLRESPDGVNGWSSTTSPDCFCTVMPVFPLP